MKSYPLGRAESLKSWQLCSKVRKMLPFQEVVLGGIVISHFLCAVDENTEA